MIEPTLNMNGSRARLTDGRCGTLRYSGHRDLPTFYIETWNADTGKVEIPMCPQTVQIARLLGEDGFALQKRKMQEALWLKINGIEDGDSNG